MKRQAIILLILFSVVTFLFLLLPGKYNLLSGVALASNKLIAGQDGFDNGQPSPKVNAETIGPYPDPLFPDQWGLHKINIEEAWKNSRGASNIIIGVIDTGVDYFHVDLSTGKTITNLDKDFVNNDDDAFDDNGHGSHVAGIAAAITDNGEGIAGVCPFCRILPVKALDASGTGSIENISNAIYYAANHGAKVMNLSLGSEDCTQELADAVNYAYDNGVVIIAAAGNACPVKVALGLETFQVNYPARFDRVIAVAATDINDARADFSSYGSEISLSAPGVGIISTYKGGTYKVLDGTSMASPFVAGTVGLLLSQNPSLTPAQVQDILQRSTDDIGFLGYDVFTGWGRLNSEIAMNTSPLSSIPAPRAICLPVLENAHAHSQAEDLLSLYRRVRDEVLLSTPMGEEYTGLFYEYGPEFARILLTDSSLRNRSAQFLQDASEEFETLLPDSIDDITLSKELYNEASSLVLDIANAGDENFRNKALQLWSEMGLEKKIGQDTKLIWNELQHPVYVPIIKK